MEKTWLCQSPSELNKSLRGLHGGLPEGPELRLQTLCMGCLKEGNISAGDEWRQYVTTASITERRDIMQARRGQNWLLRSGGRDSSSGAALWREQQRLCWRATEHVAVR